MKNSFEDKLNKLRELHDKNSMIIDHEVDYIISKYGTERKIDLKKLKTYILVIFAILCALLGLVNVFNSNIDMDIYIYIYILFWNTILFSRTVCWA